MMFEPVFREILSYSGGDRDAQKSFLLYTQFTLLLLESDTGANGGGRYTFARTMYGRTW